MAMLRHYYRKNLKPVSDRYVKLVRAAPLFIQHELSWPFLGFLKTRFCSIASLFISILYHLLYIRVSDTEDLGQDLLSCLEFHDP